MGRPTDWDVLDLPGDPVPGDVSVIGDVSRVWSAVAEDAEAAGVQVAGLLGDSAVITWLGEAGNAFREHSSKLPEQLAKCAESYELAASALSAWAVDVSSCQASADRALVLGRDARADLEAAMARVGSAEVGLRGAEDAVFRCGPGGSTVVCSPPALADAGELRAATARAAAAEEAVRSAQVSVGAAQERLEAAKRMAAQAASLRDERGHETARRLHGASDAAVPPDSFWHKFKAAMGEQWHVMVQIAKVVVAVGSIVALVVGGPIAWIVFAAALIVLADTLKKYADGKASRWDVGLSLLSCIPMTKGLTTVGALGGAFRSGGVVGAGAHLLGSAKNAGIGFVRTAQRLREGLKPGVMAMFLGIGGARSEAAKVTGLRKLSAFAGNLDARRITAVNNAWERQLADVGWDDPVWAAERWQGFGGYPGRDKWTQEELHIGTVLESGYPGPSGFMVPSGTVSTLDGDAAALAQGTQVGQSLDHPLTPHRAQAVRIRVTEEVARVATSKATANPQYGPGGLTQHYIPDFAGKVLDGKLQLIDEGGNAIRFEHLPDGRLRFHPDDGQTITLNNFGPSSYPTSQLFSRLRPELRQVVPNVLLSPWRTELAVQQ